MKKLPIFIAATLIALTTLVIQSCEKDEPNQTPVLTLSSPADSSSWTFGDTVAITGTLTDDNGLHICALAITAVNDTVFTAFPDVHDQTSYGLNLKFLPAAAGEYHLSMVIDDHDSTGVELRRVFFVKP